MKKLLCAFLCALMLTGVALPAAVSADEWQNPFVDVKPTSWYYGAVEYCVISDIMTGTSETTFEPGTELSRAMFVTMLAKYDCAELDGYTGSSFDDVPAGKWYSAAVEWAYELGVIKGTGEGLFSPGRSITREETALMFYAYANKRGLPTSLTTSYKFSRYADADRISSWALDGIRWACAAGLMDSVGNEGALPLLAPRGTSTRSQAAQMLMNLASLSDIPDSPTLKICGVDIGEYVIIRSAESGSDGKTAATQLKNFIARAYGVTLEIKDDTTAPIDHEIIVGKTQREDAGLVSVDRTGTNVLSYNINVQGTRLVLAGNLDSRGRGGTIFSVYDFAEDALGFSFLSDAMILCNPDDNDITADYTLSGGPLFKERIVYWQHGWDSVYMNYDFYHGANASVHELGAWIDGRDASEPTPCLTDEANIQKVIDRARKLMERDPSSEIMWISQNDSTQYCTCENCMACYREDGSRSSTLIRLCNRVSDALAEDYPELRIRTLAYTYSVIPPKVTVPRDNIVVYYCTIQNCASHLYSDTTCTLNRGIAANIEKWGEICKELFVWDYSTDFMYNLCPFPNFCVLRENAAWFYDNNVRGMFNNAIAETSGEFGELRAFLLTRLYRDPYMSEEDYFGYMDAYLESYYGAGWKNIREYIDLMEKYSNAQHFSFYAPPSSIFRFDTIASNADYLNGLWDRAEAQANSADELAHIQRSRLSCTYIIQCALYDSQVALGTPETREAYYKVNDSLYEQVEDFGVRWRESGQINFSRTKSPSEW